MKNIAIITNENLSTISDFIMQINKNLKVTADKNKINISLKADQIDDLITGVAIYILSDLHKTLVEKLATFLNCTQDDTIINSICNTERYNPYIEPLKILLKEHLKNNTEIYLESFVRFNCRGLQQEFYKFGQDYISIYNSEINNNNHFLEKTSKKQNTLKSDLVDSSIAYYHYIQELNEIFIKIADKLHSTSLGINYNDFENIHVKVINNQVSLVDNNNVNVQILIEDIIPFEITDENVYNNETLRLTILLLLCIIVFKTNTVVFHKSVKEDIVAQILLYLNDSKDTNEVIEDINLFKCNGCDFCY